jgi:PAS domain S-box-containing protein
MPRPRFASLRTHLVLLVLLPVLPMLGLSLYIFVEQRQQAVADAHADALRLARQATPELEELLSGTQGLLAALVQRPQVLSRNSAACTALVKSFISPFFVNLGAATPEGEVFCSALPFSGRVNIAAGTLMERAHATRGFAVWEFQVDRVSGKPSIFAVFPVLDEGGRVQAVAFAAIDLAWLNQIAARVELPPGSILTVLDASGTILARHPDPKQWVGLGVVEAPILRAIEADRGEGVAQAQGLDGVSRLLGFATVPGTVNAGRIYVVAGIRAAAALAPAERAFAAHLIGLSVVGLLALLGAWMTGSVLILRPAGALAAAARRLSAGDLRARTGLPEETGELGQLAHAFDEMAAALQAREEETEHSAQQIRDLNAQLEQRVRERTAELAVREGELREARDFLEHLIASSPVVVFRGLPGEGSVTYISGNIERILGYSTEEALTGPGFWFHRIHPDYQERFLADRERVWQARGEQFEYEVPYLHKDGSYRWFYCMVRFDYDAAATPTGVLGYALDIDERKSAEDTVKQAREVADRANQAKSDFLSRMSHELRTPLNAIVGFGQLLQMDSLTADQRESVEHILKGGHHLLNLINEVLDISRIEIGGLPISPEPVRVQEAVRESLELIAPLAAGRNIQLMDDLARTYDGHVLADRQRLKQVLLNVLSNAVKYNRDGGTVAVSCQEIPHRRVRITVRDTGPGIPPEMLARLFTPFERLGAGQTGIEGTGIGLALSKRLMELMGGEIGVESVVGQGSAFWVVLALTESPIERYERMPEGRVQAPAASAAPGNGRTVLYIEDNLANLELIQRILDRQPEIKLLSAMQGRLGLELACQHRPDLILLDLHLPDVTGDEVLRRLRETPETAEIPVVVITADSSQHQVDRLLAIGARACFRKPIDVKKLLEVLDATLKQGVSHAGRHA